MPSSDLVAEFHLNITVVPGNVFIDSGVLTGGNNLFLRLKYRVLCVEDYFGPSCITFCQETDSARGHYTCDGSGNIMCLEGYSDPSTNCTVGKTISSLPPLPILLHISSFHVPSHTHTHTHTHTQIWTRAVTQRRV